MEPILAKADEVAIPAIVLGEDTDGTCQSKYRTRYERWLRELIANCRVLPVDAEAAEEYATIRAELKIDRNLDSGP